MGNPKNKIARDKENMQKDIRTQRMNSREEMKTEE